MDFVSVVVFLFLYFIRPQDWISGMAGAPLVTINMAWAILAVWMRKGSVTFGHLARTPHDWVLAAYAAWAIFASPEVVATFQDIKSLLVFYILTLLALTSFQRVASYLQWWTIMLVGIAVLAVAGHFGMDLTGAQPLTENMKGRLVLNTWMHRNPNALGHSVAAAVSLIYFVWIWRQKTTQRVIGVLVIAVACYCIYLTQSKGAYLVAFGTLVASQLIGRSRSVQIITLLVAASLGTVAVTQLPRMDELSASEDGIQGRLLAWEVARTTMEDNVTGVGWKRFTAEFRWEKQWITKATHSSYVQVGAALGYIGLFLYVGALYCGFRTLLQAKTQSLEQERIRRVLFVLLFSYTCSNWMIDRAYHTEFFITLAAIAAFHRLTLTNRDQVKESSVEDARDAQPIVPGYDWAASLPKVNAASGIMAKAGQMRSPWSGVSKHAPATGSEQLSTEGGNPATGELLWNRIGLIDLICTAAFFWCILQIWNQALMRL